MVPQWWLKAIHRSTQILSPSLVGWCIAWISWRPRRWLLKQCAELEQLLRSDPLSFENEALEVQLQQIHADHAQLLEELKGTREFYGRRINDMTSQLEDRSRATCTAQGHADCLGDLLLFHEDNQGKSGDDGGCMGLYGVVVVVMVLYIYIKSILLIGIYWY